jgi:hypothetical protein
VRPVMVPKAWNFAREIASDLREERRRR